MAISDKQRDKKRKEMDANNDGEITPQERADWKSKQALEPDTLSRKELAAKYGYALNVIYSNPELKRLFERAVNSKDGQWTPEKFAANLRNTDWYSKGKYWRDAWVSEKEGVEWKNDIDGATEAINRRATSLGATLDDKTLKSLARRYLYEGWYDPVRSFFLDNALSSYIRKDAVGQGDLESQLRESAYSYGVDKNVNDDWYTNARQRIARGEVTVEGLQAELRDKAVSKYAPFADQIRNGQTTREAVGMYTSSLSDLLELDEKKIDLDDPLLKQAWGGVDKDGKPTMMSVYDFERKVRQDPRWRNTRNGRQTTMSTATSFLQSLGFNGVRGGNA